tara:strand:+ start:19191 stop:20165 length:975 start_codon:yes stop_codon:yes gene_type:complete
MRTQTRWIFAAAGLVSLVALGALWLVLRAAPGSPMAQAGPVQQCPAGETDERVWVAAGQYVIGGRQRYPEEAPAHLAETDGFWIDRHEVTNGQFARFVAETGYVTEAERAPDPAAHPGIDPALLVPGSAVFGVSAGEGFWWSFVPGTNWRQPFGPGSSIEGHEHYPVVHVTYADASAYAAWAGGELPDESEWEIAARAGQAGSEYEWGDEFRPGGEWRANTWQGVFPVIDSGDDGYSGLAPAGCFAPNDFGLYDMTGNVWEWTTSPFSQDAAAGTIRGGSFLCAESYCARFRPVARQAQEWDFSASHIGFRTISRTAAPPATGE